MSVTKNFTRQELQVAYVDIVLANLVSAADQEVIKLPPGSVITGGYIKPTEVFNSTSTDVLDVGDLVSENRYKDNADLTALTLVALVPTGFITTGPGVTVRWTSGGGTPTTGAFRLCIQYYTSGRGETTYG